MTVQTRQMTRTIAKEHRSSQSMTNNNVHEPLVPIPPYNLGVTIKDYVLRHLHNLIARVDQESVVENKMRINIQLYQLIGTYFPQVPCHDAWLILAITIYYKTDEFIADVENGVDKDLSNLYIQELSKVKVILAEYIKTNAPGGGKYLIPNL
jgi:hypothetical protein